MTAVGEVRLGVEREPRGTLKKVEHDRVGWDVRFRGKRVVGFGYARVG